LPPQDPSGTTLAGKYRIRGVLGRGGMGTVFEAERLSIGGLVAIKVLRSDRARDAKVVRRFYKEARAAAAIGHPNICEVHDLGGLEEGSPYLVMERLVGETLAVRLARDTVLPFDEAIDVLVQVLSALAAAHEKGIVHRDIKPENIFLAERIGCPPFVKVLDFGISKIIGRLRGDVSDDTRLTQPGVVMGTPSYMSPEQVGGDRGLDARVDIYACGVILYEALTGRRPFTGRDLQTLLLQILTIRPPLASELRPGLPAGIDAVLERALARRRDDRYRTAREMQLDLHPLRASSGPFLAAGNAATSPSKPWVDPSAPTSPLASTPSNATPEPPPSSLDIPIEFTTESPPSGAILPADEPAGGEIAPGEDRDDTVVTHVERTELLERVPKRRPQG
jgi:serine/threonine-protein kinase